MLDDEKIFDLILETVLCKNKSIVVASSEYPAELVRSKFLKLNMFHVEYAMDCMRKNTSKIHNIKKYLLVICPLSSRQVKYLKVSDKNTYISFWSVGIFMHTISLYIFQFVYF